MATLRTSSCGKTRHRAETRCEKRKAMVVGVVPVLFGFLRLPRLKNARTPSATRNHNKSSIWLNPVNNPLCGYV